MLRSRDTLSRDDFDLSESVQQMVCESAALFGGGETRNAKIIAWSDTPTHLTRRFGSNCRWATFFSCPLHDMPSVACRSFDGERHRIRENEEL